MKRHLTLILGLLISGWLVVNVGYAWRGGGRGGGGGGGMRGGGGGGFRGGAPAGGFSGGGRPAAARPAPSRPAPSRPAPSRPAASRPATGGGVANRGPSFSTPGGGRPAAKPGGGAVAGNRPALQPGTRPPLGGAGAANRPAIGSGAGQRPAIGSGGAAGQRPALGGAAGQRPAVGGGAGQRPSVGTGAIAGNRRTTLPGLGGEGGLQGRAANRPQTREDRAASLQDRMAGGGDRQNMGERQGQRQESRGERQQSRQDFRNENREDWQNWAGEHGDWYHGAWAGGWYPGAGWGYMWENHPVAAALGVTWWGANRLSYAFGMGDYGNPYYSEGGGGGYDYSQPIAAYEPVAETQPAATAEPAPTDATGTGATTPPGVSAEGMALFDQSREAFARGDYKQALALCDQSLKTMPNDAVVHEFRSLTLFALKNYREAAAAAYAVLSAGPGWDWTTLSSLYASVAAYTPQLRALEEYVKQNPKSSDARFLLAYHYLTGGHAEAAHKQLVEVNQLTPNDRLVTQLLTLTAKPGENEPIPTPKPPLEGDKLLTAEQLVGDWTAAGSSGSKFQMTLNKDASFAWKFKSGKKSDEIRGVFAVEQNNLALQVDDGTVLLAEIALEGDQLSFKIIGSDAGDPALSFRRSK